MKPGFRLLCGKNEDIAICGGKNLELTKDDSTYYNYKENKYFPNVILYQAFQSNVSEGKYVKDGNLISGLYGEVKSCEPDELGEPYDKILYSFDKVVPPMFGQLTTRIFPDVKYPRGIGQYDQARKDKYDPINAEKVGPISLKALIDLLRGHYGDGTKLNVYLLSCLDVLQDAGLQRMDGDLYLADGQYLFKESILKDVTEREPKVLKSEAELNSDDNITKPENLNYKIVFDSNPDNQIIYEFDPLTPSIKQEYLNYSTKNLIKEILINPELQQEVTKFKRFYLYVKKFQYDDDPKDPLRIDLKTIGKTLNAAIIEETIKKLEAKYGDMSMEQLEADVRERFNKLEGDRKKILEAEARERAKERQFPAPSDEIRRGDSS